MEQDEVFRSAIEILERLQIPYLVVGSAASSIYGEPRLTNDVDIVIDPTRTQIDQLCSACADGSPAPRAAVAGVIISKLLYYQEGGSEKHLRDITGMLKVSANKIDHEYLAQWVKQLGLDAEWAAVSKRASS